MKGYIYFALGITAIAALTFTHWKAYSMGRALEQAAMVKTISEENTAAGESAEEWRAKFRACKTAGGQYNFETGACE